MGILRRFKRGAWIVIICWVFFIAYWWESEVYYSRSIRPTNVVTVSDFYHRWGAPLAVRMVKRDGVIYYRLSGHGPERFSMAMPSSNPAYIFDESGKLVDWCPDPGDATFQKGIYMGGEKIDSDSFQKKFGIETPGTPPGHND